MVDSNNPIRSTWPKPRDQTSDEALRAALRRLVEINLAHTATLMLMLETQQRLNTKLRRTQSLLDQFLDPGSEVA